MARSHCSEWLPAWHEPCLRWGQCQTCPVNHPKCPPCRHAMPVWGPASRSSSVTHARSPVCHCMSLCYVHWKMFQQQLPCPACSLAFHFPGVTVCHAAQQTGETTAIFTNTHAQEWTVCQAHHAKRNWGSETRRRAAENARHHCQNRVRN